MARINHENNRATNLTSNTAAGDTTSPLNSIPSVDAPFYIAFDATNINGHYEALPCTSKTATNVNHAALAYAHTTAEEVRLVIPAAEMNNLGTLAEQTNGAWVAWTPTWTNLTIGNATVSAKYTQLGKHITGIIDVTWGSTTSATGAFTFSLPVTSTSRNGTAQTQVIGNAFFFDQNTTTTYSGNPRWATTGTATLVFGNAAATAGLTLSGVTQTAPFTWTTSDEIHIEFTFEAA